MLLAFILRRVLLITILIVPQWFWIRRGWRLAARSQSGWLRRIVAVLLGAAVVTMSLVLYDRISQRILPKPFSAGVAPLVQLWIFTSTFTFFCEMLLRFVLWCGASARRLFVRKDHVTDANRRATFRYAALTLRASPFVAAAYGYGVERLNFEVVHVDVPIANLPGALNGLRIVQLSDIHAGNLMPMPEIRKAVDIARNLDAHLAVVTGDFVSGHGDPLEACIAELSLLRAPLGIWGCNGNHEIYAGVEDEAGRLFAQYDMRLLRQAAAQLTWNGASFNLMGIDYQHSIQLTGRQQPSLGGIEPLVRRDVPNILLSHNPNTFNRAAEMGIELSLAGHTHGGQVNVEIVDSSWNPAKFMTPFIAGLYELPMTGGISGSKANPANRARLYVNRGIGTLGVPVRIGARPEITLLTLRTA
jgi:predicted MPP superfamily phosphohydrolase